MNQSVYRGRLLSNQDENTQTLDNCNNILESIEDTQSNTELQLSEELVYVKNSIDIRITTTDIKAALSLQLSLQAAIAVLISITVNDTENAELITQELLQSTKIKQITRQKTIIENSSNVDIVTQDTQISANIQLLLTLLLTLLDEIDV